LLCKLDMIVDNQKEQIALLRQIAASTQKDYVEVVEDVLPNKLESVAELEQFNNKLGDPDFKKQMVILQLMSLFDLFSLEFY